MSTILGQFGDKSKLHNLSRSDGRHGSHGCSYKLPSRPSSTWSSTINIFYKIQGNPAHPVRTKRLNLKLFTPHLVVGGIKRNRSFWSLHARICESFDNAIPSRFMGSLLVTAFVKYTKVFSMSDFQGTVWRLKLIQALRVVLLKCKASGGKLIYKLRTHRDAASNNR